MKFNVLYFGIAKDFSGKRTESFFYEAAPSIEQFKRDLQIKFPELSKIKSYRIAKNESFVTQMNEQIQDGDEIANIPPVSGG